MEDYNKDFGKRIKQLRKVRGLTQAQLADIVCRTKNHISKIELGTANPPLSLIFEIAGALNVTAEQLFSSNQQTPQNLSDTIQALSDKDCKQILKTFVKNIMDYD